MTVMTIALSTSLTIVEEVGGEESAIGGNP